MIPRKGKGGNASSGTGTKKEQNVRRLEWVEGEMVGIRGIREVDLWWMKGHTPSEGVGWRAQRHGVRSTESKRARAEHGQCRREVNDPRHAMFSKGGSGATREIGNGVQ